ncbi:MAG: hypothetical protein E7473_11710 [Ruminococcaceae bacterium]|nr:hypothetical protein [Oscillospiraceae bacterium]
MKKYLSGIGKYAGVFAVTLFLLWLVLFLSALIPNDSIRDNMEKSALSYKKSDAFEFTDDNNLNSVSDNYADTIWLNVAWNMGKENPLSATIATNYYDGEGYGENAGLYLTIAGDVPPNTDYTRYWHGTAAFLRITHLFTDISGAKTIGFILFLSLLALTSFMLVRKKHWDIALILLSSLALVHIWRLHLSIEYQPSFILTFALIPLYLTLERKGDKWLKILGVIGGASVAFFDFLTTETVTILLPLALVIAIRAKEERLQGFKESLFLIIKCLILWGCAYIGAFFIKWIIASLVTGGNVFEIALSSVSERLGEIPASFVEKSDSFLSAPLANLNMLFGGGERVDYTQVFVGVAISASVLISVWYVFRKSKSIHPASKLLLILGAVVLLRYLILNNHSYIHCFFTYRALSSLIFAILSATWLDMRFSQGKKRKK